MNVTIDITGHDTGKIAALMRQLGPGNRRRLHAVGAKDAQVRIRKHLGRIAASRHASAAAVGGRPTGHIRKGLSSITMTANEKEGVVTIPIPGITRARRDINLSAPTSNGKKYLTIPKHSESYGHTVPEMKERGWKIFRPGQKKVLLGYKKKGDKPVILFALATKVSQKKDPSLLPTAGEIYLGAMDAMNKTVNQIIAKARNAY